MKKRFKHCGNLPKDLNLRERIISLIVTGRASRVVDILE